MYKRKLPTKATQACTYQAPLSSPAFRGLLKATLYGDLSSITWQVLREAEFPYLSLTQLRGD
jgi:hypothetical protein